MVSPTASRPRRRASSVPDREASPMAGKRTDKGIDQPSARDKVVVALMVIVPTILVTLLILLPAVGPGLLSFTNLDGVWPPSGIQSVRLQKFKDSPTIYPP